MSNSWSRVIDLSVLNGRSLRLFSLVIHSINTMLIASCSNNHLELALITIGLIEVPAKAQKKLGYLVRIFWCFNVDSITMCYWPSSITFVQFWAKPLRLCFLHVTASIRRCGHSPSRIKPLQNNEQGYWVSIWELPVLPLQYLRNWYLPPMRTPIPSSPHDGCPPTLALFWKVLLFFTSI